MRSRPLMKHELIKPKVMYVLRPLNSEESFSAHADLSGSIPAFINPTDNRRFLISELEVRVAIWED